MSELADKILDQLHTEGISIKDAITALTEVQYRLLNGSAHTQPKVAVPTAPIQSTKKAIKYDPYTDPAPPMEIDRPPERVEPAGKVIISRNQACICNACKKVVYTTTRDITNGMTYDDFAESFIPTAGNAPIGDRIEIQNLDGVISIDCPACGAVKQLYLSGGPKV